MAWLVDLVGPRELPVTALIDPKGSSPPLEIIGLHAWEGLPAGPHSL